jgi:hypothetical protein
MSSEIAHNRRIPTLDTALAKSDCDFSRTSAPVTIVPALVAFILFLVLAVVHTWPLASAPGRLSRNDNADTILNEWSVAWVAHQALHDPAHLVDANIFHPERGTLAYSEYLIVPAAMGAPLLWLGSSPVLVYNLLVLIGLTLTGWATWLLVHRWTGDHAAAVIAGVILAFNAHTLTRLPQLQALHAAGLPLALLALDELLLASDRRRGIRAAVLLAILIVLQGLTSYYLLVFTTIALAIGVAVRVEDWRATGGREIARRLALTATIVVAVLLPALWPYARLGHVRELDEVAAYSAAWRDYLASPARIHFGTWSARFFGDPTALFPGVVALVLSAVAIGSGVALRNRRARMALAFGLVGLALSFGPACPGYALLYRVFLPLQGIRNAARFGYLAIVATAILSGFAVASLRRRRPHARWMPAVVALLFVGANLDALSAPLELVDAEPVSPLYASLAGTNAVVAEFPFYSADRLFRHAPYLLHATTHWRPMVNGYSGFVPASYLDHARDLARFPDARAMATLRALGVTHVFVHDRALRDWTDNETADAVAHTADLVRVASDGDLTLYTIK